MVIGLAFMVGRAAAHGGDSNLIHACVNNASGEIKIVNANDTCPNSSTALDWNPQHPILVLPGESSIDLSGLDCDPEILFFSDDSLGQARLVYECGPEAFSFRTPDGQAGETRILNVSDNLLDLSGMTGNPTLQIKGGQSFIVNDGTNDLVKVAETGGLNTVRITNAAETMQL